MPGWGSVGAGSVCGLVGLGSSGVSSGGASAPSVACTFFYPWTYLHLVYLPSAVVQHLPTLTGGPLWCLPLGHL